MSGNMGLMPTQKCISLIREAFPENAEVELIFMDDLSRAMPKGMKGIVKFIDDMGTIHVLWETGSSLGVVWNADVVKNIETGVQSSEFWDDSCPRLW